MALTRIIMRRMVIRRSLNVEEPERITVATVSANFCSALGVEPLVGRTFAEPIADGTIRPVVLQPSRFLADAMSIVVRTDRDPARFGTASRHAVREAHRQAPVSSIRPMPSVAAAGVERELTALRALAIFGGLALVLAAVGLHGVMTRLVGDRTRELGVRLALGAAPRAVRWLVVGRTLKLSVVGLTAGAAASIVLSRQLGSLLHGASAADPVVLAAVSAILFAVALLASYGPARRASRTDPLVVMKSE